MTTNNSKTTTDADTCFEALMRETLKNPRTELTNREIAELTGLSVSKVRRALESEFERFGWNRVTPVETYRETYRETFSKSYPGTVVGHRKQTAWIVSREALVARITDAELYFAARAAAEDESRTDDAVAYRQELKRRGIVD
jgi:hypothetical protein